jgi:hypothetical protein
VAPAFGAKPRMTLVDAIVGTVTAIGAARPAMVVKTCRVAWRFIAAFPGK